MARQLYIRPAAWSSTPRPRHAAFTAGEGGVLPALNRNVERVFSNRKDSQGESGSWQEIADARLEMKEAAN
jgi:hypothetical protein